MRADGDQKQFDTPFIQLRLDIPAELDGQLPACSFACVRACVCAVWVMACEKFYACLRKPYSFIQCVP